MMVLRRDSAARLRVVLDWPVGFRQRFGQQFARREHEAAAKPQDRRTAARRHHQGVMAPNAPGRWRPLSTALSRQFRASSWRRAGAAPWRYQDSRWAATGGQSTAGQYATATRKAQLAGKSMPSAGR